MKKDRYSTEKVVLQRLLEEKREFLSREVLTVLETLVELLVSYPEAVREFNLAGLHEYMAGKAGKFHDRYREHGDGAVIEKDNVYLYRYASVTITYRAVVHLYPLMLVSAVNYSNLVSYLCRELQKKGEEMITLETFLDTYYGLSRRCKPKLEKRDIKLLKELSKFDFSNKHYFRKLQGYEAKKRFQKLAYLGVVSLYHVINFPALGLEQYIHLAPGKASIPAIMKPFIEYEYHAEKKGKDYQVFRLFLVPETVASEWVPVLRELGTAGKVTEWYVSYNWNRYYQNTEYNWKWRLEFEELTVPKNVDTDRFDQTAGTRPRPLTSGFLTYLEAVHQLHSVNDSDIAARTGTSEHTIVKYRRRALAERAVLPYWNIGSTGLDSHYMVCFDNSETNDHLARFLDTLPTVKAMKSREFSRYLLLLPAFEAYKLNKRLLQGEQEGEFTVSWRRKVTADDLTVRYGVDLKQLHG